MNDETKKIITKEINETKWEIKKLVSEHVFHKKRVNMIKKDLNKLDIKINQLIEDLR